MDPITISIKNNVATISNNDAPYNRMTLEYMDALESALPELEGDDKVRALDFYRRGRGTFFRRHEPQTIGRRDRKKGLFRCCS